MAAVGMKAEYGPSLGRLLAPRWRAASLRGRAAAVAGTLALVAVLLAVGLTLENATYSHGGSLPFSFSYRDLYRVAPDPGGYVRVRSRFADGTLQYSYAVDPLRLPPYSGGVSGELPIYAAGYIRALSHRYRGFALRGEGKTMLNGTLSAYQIAYSAYVEGQMMFARSLLLMPAAAGVREGVIVVVMASPRANARLVSALEVAISGPLLRPVKTFAFG
jgi:hypothetical protein